MIMVFHMEHRTIYFAG